MIRWGMRWVYPLSVLFFAASVALAVSARTLAQAQGQSVINLPNPYHLVEGWPQLDAGRSIGATSAIDIDRDGRSVWVVDRSGGYNCADSALAPVMKIDPSGNVVESFGADIFAFPHGIFVDRDGNVWVVDGQGTTDAGVRTLPDAARPHGAKGH